MKKSIIYLSLCGLFSCSSIENSPNFVQAKSVLCTPCMNVQPSPSTAAPTTSASTPTKKEFTPLSPLNQGIQQKNSQEAAKLNNNPLIAIINSALEFNNATSSLPAIVEQRKAEAEIIERNNWPSIQPVMRYSSQVQPYIGVNASYTLFDFGLASQKEEESKLNISGSEIERLVEERTVIATTLESLATIASLVENKKLLTQAIKDIQRLSKFADIRLQAGVSSLSEINTIDLRLSELQSELDSAEININLNLELLSSKLITPVTLEQIPSLSEMANYILPELGDVSLQLRQAEINKDIAKTQLEQAKSQIYPHLGVEAEAGKSTDGDNVHTIGLVMQIPTSVFSASATVKAAESAYQAKDRTLTSIQKQLDTENKRIALETNKLNSNRKTLESLESRGVSAVDIFNVEFEANSSSLSDGLTAYRTLLQTRQQLVSLKAELINLKASKIKITSGTIFK